MPALLAGADLVVHNAGGLALTESLVAGVPAITFAALPGHGKANARSLERSGTAPWARSPEELTLLASEACARQLKRWPEDAETTVDRISQLLMETARLLPEGRLRRQAATANSSSTSALTSGTSTTASDSARAS